MCNRPSVYKRLFYINTVLFLIFISCLITGIVMVFTQHNTTTNTTTNTTIANVMLLVGLFGSISSFVLLVVFMDLTSNSVVGLDQ